ncbi:MAG: KEOPS complex subunit Cgi121 [Halobacteriota archaeon]
MAQTMHYDLLAGRIAIENVQGYLSDLNKIALSCQTTIQAVDASKIAGQQHIDYAVNKAIRSFEDRNNIAQDLGVEILLQLSASRQIRKALDMGVRTGEMEVVFIVVGTVRSIEETIKKLTHLTVPDERLVEYRETKRASLMQTFTITDVEVDAVGGSHKIPALVRERIALFNAFK